MNSAVNILKLFGMANQLVEADLDQIERKYDLDLGRRLTIKEPKDSTYYPQFDKAIRDEAASMALHYEIFYCLEKSIRQIVSEKLEEAEGKIWWSSKRINQKVKDDVEFRIQRDRDSGVTLRSTAPLDFTTFGELGTVIRENWDVFGDIFNSKKAVEKVMASLNTLRGPIAHCSPLAEDEVLRLQLSLRDWFRLME